MFQRIFTTSNLRSPSALVRRAVAIYHLLLLYRVLAICAALTTLSFLLPDSALAQAVATAERPQAIAVAQFMVAQPGDHSTWLYGGNGSLELKSCSFWGIRGDVSGQHWNSRATRYFGGLGPQLDFNRRSITLHADILAGLSRDRPWVPAPPTKVVTATAAATEDGRFYGHQYSFAARAGAGVDLHLSNRWMLRLAEVSVTQSISSHEIHNVDYSSGVAYVF